MRVTDKVAALLIGMLIGIGLTMALQVSSPSADAGDWLAFTGALVGVVVTILGTLWINHYQTATQERAQRKTVVTVLNEISSALDAARAPRGDEAIQTARPGRVALEEALLQTLDKFTYARHFIPHHDIDAWHAMEALNTAIVKDRPLIEHEARLLHEIGDRENVFSVNIDKMDQVAQRLTSLLNTAKEELRD